MVWVTTVLIWQTVGKRCCVYLGVRGSHLVLWRPCSWNLHTESSAWWVRRTACRRWVPAGAPVCVSASCPDHTGRHTRSTGPTPATAGSPQLSARCTPITCINKSQSNFVRAASPPLTAENNYAAQSPLVTMGCPTFIAKAEWISCCTASQSVFPCIHSLIHSFRLKTYAHWQVYNEPPTLTSSAFK